jgi:hypothetical protein
MKIRDILLENLVLETPEQVRSEIIQKISKIQDEPDLVNVLKFTNQYAYKKDVGKLSTVKGFKDSVSNIILQAVGNVDAPDTLIRAFLKRLSTDGVIKENLLLTPGMVHVMDDIVDMKFRGIFNAIKLDLFEKISGKMGEKGDVGKGEYLLSILSPRIVRRGAPGDIAIAGGKRNVKVELKAGESGRLGPAGSQAIAGRFDEFIKLCIKNKVLTLGTFEMPNPVDLNFTLNMTKFSAFFGNEQAKVSKALAIALKMHYPTLNTTSMAKSIVQDGQIDGQELKAQMLAASYSVYQAAKGFDGILLTDYGINRYLYMNTPQSAASSGNFVTVKFPSWTDTQSNTMKIQLKSSAR